jgi:hypothetical protein
MHAPYSTDDHMTAGLEGPIWGRQLAGGRGKESVGVYAVVQLVHSALGDTDALGKVVR